ncbi:hypothetical protein [Mycoplasma todarodis]|uniref:hypothetical protein n=1 Tax=Mycoplasma todarodis TaxID=1937191 RepID=UPI003B35F121
MTIIKKKIGLGVLAAVSVAAVPIATTISCGKKSNDDSGTISSEFSAGMPLTWNIMNANGQASINSVVENSKKADALAAKHNWKKVFEGNAKLLDQDDAKYEEKREEDSKRINKEMMKAISGLSDIEKRSMVISGTDIDVDELDATKDYKITVYTTIHSKDGSDMSPELKEFIGKFLKHSNSKAKSFSDGSKLDEVDEVKRKDKKLEDYAMKRYLSAQRSMRNFGDDGNSVNSGEAFYDNGFFDFKQEPVPGQSKWKTTVNKYKDFTDEVFAFKNGKKGALASVWEGKDKKHLDVSSVPTYDVQQGEFRQNITFYEGIDLIDEKSKDGKWTMSVPGWTGNGEDLAGHTPEFKGYKMVFTMNPLIQKFGDGSKFKAAGFENLSDDQLVEYIGMIHKIMYQLAPGKITDGLGMLTDLLPTATPFISTNLDWCNSLDQIKVNSGTADAAVSEIENLVRNNIGKVRKAINDKKTISQERMTFAFYRDHNAETKKAFSGSSEHWEVRKKVETTTKEITDKFNLTALDGANTQVISMLFDYINTLYSLGNVLTDLAWDAELIG